MALPAGAKWGHKVQESAVSGKSSASEANKTLNDEADAAKKDLRKVVLDSGAIIKGRRLEPLGDAFWTVRSPKMVDLV